MEMVTVYLGLLRRGPRAAEWDERPHELEQLQEAHLANIRRMYEIGKLLIAGPCTDNGDLRGVYVFKTESWPKPRRWRSLTRRCRPGGCGSSFIPG